jgi:hypothetical protein
MPVPRGFKYHRFYIIYICVIQECACVWQLWLRMAVMSFFTLCLVLLWLVAPGWCSSQEFSWLGLMPMQVRSHCIPQHTWDHFPRLLHAPEPAESDLWTAACLLVGQCISANVHA